MPLEPKSVFKAMFKGLGPLPSFHLLLLLSPSLLIPNTLRTKTVRGVLEFSLCSRKTEDSLLGNFKKVWTQLHSSTA